MLCEISENDLYFQNNTQVDFEEQDYEIYFVFAHGGVHSEKISKIKLLEGMVPILKNNLKNKWVYLSKAVNLEYVVAIDLYDFSGKKVSILDFF